MARRCQLLRIASWFFGRKGHPYTKIESRLFRLFSRMEDIEHEAFHDMTILGPGRLDRFDVLVTYTQHAPGRPLSPAEEETLSGFVASGGGLVGIHGATASFKDNPRYHGVLGGRFTGHGLPCKIEAHVVDAGHPVTSGISSFIVKDEPYNHELLGDPVHVLVDRPGKHDAREPMAWVKTHDEGRVAYIAFGHYPKVIEHPAVAALVRNAVAWTGKQ